MNDLSRIQVRKNDTEHAWGDVGNKTGDESVPVTIGSLPLPTGGATSDNQTNGTQQAKIKETVPTDATKNNPATTLSYDVNGDLQYIDEVISGVTYRTTLTYTARVLNGISATVAL
jgi:hypothetical protein